MFPVAPILTAAASYASAAAVGKVVSDVVKSNVNPVTTMEKIQVAVGTTVLSATLGHMANAYVAGSIRETVETVKKFRAAKNAVPTT